MCSEEVIEGIYGKVGETTLLEVKFRCLWVQFLEFSAGVRLDLVGVED